MSVSIRAYQDSKELLYVGIYTTVRDDDTGYVIRREIEVFVADGELFTDHRFYLAGIEFMSLHYEITGR